jgi:leucyl aminopeptidase
LKIELAIAAPLRASSDAVGAFVFQSEAASRLSERKRAPPLELPEPLAGIDRRLSGHLRATANEESFCGAAESTLMLQTRGRLSAARVFAFGLGARSRYTPEALRQAAGRAVRAASQVSARRLELVLPGAAPIEDEVRAVAEGALLGAYRFDRYRSEKDANRRPLNVLRLLLPKGADLPRSRAALALAREVAEAVCWARDLVNEPAGVMTPKRLAQEARDMAKGAGLQVQVLGRAEIEKLRMGMFLGVAQGSSEKPRLVSVKYQPKGTGRGTAPLALVGKAITFDSGGLSLKPVDGMLDMKTDMAGSAAALAAMRVIAHLAPPFPVHAYLGACENMPGGRAYKPGDVLIARNGKTVEVTNTDAEGRLVLGDVLTWACEERPFGVIDLATLTGACVVALGHWTTGAFGPDGPLMNELLEAARASGEDVWRLPLTEWVKDSLKSDVADLKNCGERWGGAISAGLFLREFVGDTPWVHLDIAGPSFSPKERGYLAKGGTGVGVRTLVEYVKKRAETARTN